MGPSDVGERSERTRREEVIAASEQHVAIGEMPVDELLDQRRLSRAGLAADEHQTARLVRPLEPVEKDGQLLVPFEKAHRHPTIRDRDQHGPGTRTRHPSAADAAGVTWTDGWGGRTVVPWSCTTWMPTATPLASATPAANVATNRHA